MCVFECVCVCLRVCVCVCLCTLQHETISACSTRHGSLVLEITTPLEQRTLGVQLVQLFVPETKAAVVIRLFYVCGCNLHVGKLEVLNCEVLHQ